MSFHSRKRGLHASTYFDNLSEDELMNILRFTSGKPRHVNWTSYIKSPVALTLLRTVGPLSEITSRLFQVLELEVRRQSSQPVRKGSVVLKARYQSPSNLNAVIEYIGRRLYEVRAHGLWHPKNEKVMYALLSGGKNIKHLSFCDLFRNQNCHLAEILEACTGKLEVLEICQRSLEPSHITAIATHCGKLTHLSVAVTALNGELAPIWVSIGDTLKQLCVECDIRREIDFQRFSFHILPLNCTKLERLQFSSNLSGRTDRLYVLDGQSQRKLERLCETYSSQLESICLSNTGIRPNVLRSITLACPSLKICLHEPGGCTFSALVAADSNLAEVTIGNHFTNDISDAVQEAGNLCENLESLHIVGFRVSIMAFRALFIHPKPRLVHFTATDIKNHTTEEVLTLLSVKVCVLQTFQLRECDIPEVAFRKFAIANKSLREVRLISRRHCLERGNKPDWASVIQCCFECPLLSQLEISCPLGHCNITLDDVVQVCHRFRSRSISVSVCGIQYL